MFVVPVTEGPMKHTCVSGDKGGAAICRSMTSL